MKKLKFGSKAYRLKYLGKKKKSRSGGRKIMAKKKTYTKKSGMMDRVLRSIIPVGVAIGYGAFRQPIASKLPDIPKIENYSDEIVLGGGALLTELIFPNKYVKMATSPIKSVEFARIGEKIRLKVPMSNNGGSSENSASNGVIFY